MSLRDRLRRCAGAQAIKVEDYVMSDFRAGEPPKSAVVDVTTTAPIRLTRSWISALGLQMTVVVLLQAAYALAIAGQLGALSPARALLTMGLFIPESIGRRLINDYDDYGRGVDRVDNARPGSALALGLSMAQVRVVGLACFAIAVVPMIYLLYTTSPVSVVILPLAFVTLIYSGGPSPLGYHGLGEVVDFVLTGCLVVGAVVWVNVHIITLPVVLGAIAAGFLFAATMFHNDLRDIVEDMRAGKRTIAHVLSPRSAKIWYAILMLAPYPCVLLIAYQFHSPRYAAPLLLLPWAVYLTMAVVRSRLGDTMPSWLHMPRLLASFFALFVLAAWI
jgi:1,4-dihydroxy-2-naphthoate polyprenyltransferase